MLVIVAVVSVVKFVDRLPVWATATGQRARSFHLDDPPLLDPQDIIIDRSRLTQERGPCVWACCVVSLLGEFWDVVN